MVVLGLDEDAEFRGVRAALEVEAEVIGLLPRVAEAHGGGAYRCETNSGPDVVTGLREVLTTACREKVG